MIILSPLMCITIILRYCLYLSVRPSLHTHNNMEEKVLISPSECFFDYFL